MDNYQRLFPTAHNLINFGVKFTTCLPIMPPIRTVRTRTGDENAQTNMHISSAIFQHLTIAQLQALCRCNGLSTLGRRTALEKRLINASIVQTAHSSERTADRQLHPGSPSTISAQQRASPAAFTEGQLSEIKRLIQDSVAAASRDIAREAARAVTEAMQSQVPSSLPSSSPQVMLQTTSPRGVDTPQQQQQAGQSLQLNDGPPSLAPCRNGAPFQDIPTTNVKEIQSGELFDLSKLLPKKLSLHD